MKKSSDGICDQPSSMGNRKPLGVCYYCDGRF